ncbi:MAG: DUF4838 domain-containing protein [Clostridia bacterium]|nr:DUF4838 domain-containing protein [Clostridia bacterium]
MAGYFFDARDIGGFKIVYGECRDETLKNAAEDLAYYLNSVYPAELKPVCVNEFEDTSPTDVIFVGPTEYDTEKVKKACVGLYNNGLAIVADGSNLYLTGENETGAMYAVYTFLEDYIGVRFYSSKCERILYRERILLPDDACITFSPKLLSRDTFWYDTFDMHFAAKLKINGGFRRPGKNYGRKIEYAGGFVHTFPDLAGTEHTPNVQPCLTDPAVYERVLSNVRKLLDDNKDAKIISVSQNDSYADGLGCQCDKCRAIDEREGTPMGSLLTFVNKIANAIKDEYPDVLVDTLAYRYTRKAPKTIKPADNVIIRLCSIECCFSHNLTSGCPQNEAFRKDIEEWSSICKNLFIWDYTTDYMHYLIPFPNLGVLYDNIRFFVNHNAIGLFEQGNGQSISAEFGELRAYLIAKVMWNPDMTRDEFNSLADDFLEGYYGPGRKYVKEYIEKTSKLASESHMGIYDSLENNLTLGGKDRKAVIEELEELFDRAIEVSDEEHFENVDKSSIQVKYAKLLTLWDEKSSPAELSHLCKMIQNYNITHYREGVLMPKEPDFTKPLKTW